MKNILKKSWYDWSLCLILFLGIMLRLPSLFEPLWYDDEAITLAVGKQLAYGSTLYIDTIDHKPPIIYWIASLAGNLFLFRVISFIWVLVSLYFFYKLARLLIIHLVENPKFRKIALLISILIITLIWNTPLIEGNLVNGEILMMGPLIIGWYFFWKARNEKNPNSLLLSTGIFWGVALMIKIPSFTDLIVWGLMLIGQINLRNIKGFWQQVYPICCGILIILFIVFIWTIFQNNGIDFVQYVLSFNVNYIRAWSEKQSANYVSTLPWELIIRSIIALLFSIYLYLWKISDEKKFVFLWFIWSLWGSLLSERPYPHYLIQIIPSTALILGMAIYNKITMQILIILLMLFLVIVQNKYEFWRYPVIKYYENFYSNIKYISNQIINPQSFLQLNKKSYLHGFNQLNKKYLDWFDPHTTDQYNVSNWIINNTNLEDKIFIFGGKPGIYVLSNRPALTNVVTDFHIEDFGLYEHVKSKLSANRPIVIITGHNSINWDWLEIFLKENYEEKVQEGKFIIWKLKS